MEANTTSFIPKCAWLVWHRLLSGRRTIRRRHTLNARCASIAVMSRAFCHCRSQLRLIRMGPDRRIETLAQRNALFPRNVGAVFVFRFASFHSHWTPFRLNGRFFPRLLGALETAAAHA